MSYEDQLAAEARAMIAELQDSLDEIRAATAEILEVTAREQAEDEASDEARARQARAGDFGPDWQRVQERMDRGETSVSAIVRGWDQSREADALRETSVANLVDLRFLLEAEEAAPDQPIIHMAGAPRQDDTPRLPPEAREAMAQAKDSMAALEALKERLHSIPLPDED